jgi:hypothetical protein
MNLYICASKRDIETRIYIYIYSQLHSMILLVYKMPVFILSVRKCFKMKYYTNGSYYCKHMVEIKKCWLITKT